MEFLSCVDASLKKNSLMRRVFISLSLILSVAQVAVAASLEQEEWPSAGRCENCFHVQVRHLDLQLPLAKTCGIFSTGIGGNGVEIMPASCSLAETVFIFDRDREQLFSNFRESDFLARHKIKTTSDFFTTIGNDENQNDKLLQKIRRLFGVDVAPQYRQMKKNGLTAFVIGATDPRNQRIFFVFDDQDTYYEISGYLTDDLAHHILINAQPVEMP